MHEKNSKNFEKTIDKSNTKRYNIDVIKRGDPQKERWIIMKNAGKYIAVDNYNNRFIVNNTHYNAFMRNHGVQSVVYFDRATGEQIFKAETLPDGRVIKI